MTNRAPLIAILLPLLLSSPSTERLEAAFVRGDTDVNGEIELSDAVRIFTYLFLDLREPPPCMDALDADDTGNLDITDGVYLLSYLFLGGFAPPRPFPDCGIDPTDDALDCERYSLCGSPGSGLEIHFDTEGGFTGRGLTDYHILDDVLTVHSPFRDPTDCDVSLEESEFAKLLDAATTVAWAEVAKAYINPENPNCCCDQIYYSLDVTAIVEGDIAIGATTSWCDETRPLLPADLDAFLGVLADVGAGAADRCDAEE